MTGAMLFMSVLDLERMIFLAMTVSLFLGAAGFGSSILQAMLKVQLVRIMLLPLMFVLEILALAVAWSCVAVSPAAASFIAELAEQKLPDRDWYFHGNNGREQ